ncbi:MAG TPA: four helix bundle protein [Polyangiaceae bacterium]|nr:four helix bundle protein [Polyangiaceae bacterium]
MGRWRFSSCCASTRSFSTRFARSLRSKHAFVSTIRISRQLRRAASSIALNCAEGTGSQGGNVKARFRNALGSTYETRACLDVASVFGYVEVKPQLHDDLDRIGATLYRLIE